MTTATASTGISLDEVKAWSEDQLKAHAEHMKRDMEILKKLEADKKAQAEADEVKEVEALVDSFNALPSTLFKLEVAGEVQAVSLETALKGIACKIKAKAKGSDELVDRDHTAKLNSMTVTALRKAVENLRKIAAGEPRRIRNAD